MLAHIITYFRVKKNKEDPARINEKFGIASNEAIKKLEKYKQFCKKNKTKNKIAWIHAVSVGESLSVIEFVNKISKKGYFIVFTTTTITAAKIISDKLPENSIHQYSAFQTTRYLKRFLKFWQPKIVFFTESEIFPSLINILHKDKIPFYLLNARLSEKSFKLWKIVKFYIKPLLKKYSFIFPLSEQEQEKFKILSNNQAKIKYFGNLKFDAAISSKNIIEKNFNNKNNNKIVKCNLLSKLFNDKTIIVFGSIHKEEYNYILKQYSEITKKNNCIGVVVPRYIEESEKLKKQALNIGLKPIYVDNLTKQTKNKNLIIINKMDMLKYLYKICDVAVICGSFARGIGGHNPIESIVMYKPTFIGSYCHKTQDLIDYLKKNEVIIQTMNLYNEILLHLTDKNKKMKLKKNIQNLIKNHKNVSDKILNLIKI